MDDDPIQADAASDPSAAPVELALDAESPDDTDASSSDELDIAVDAAEDEASQPPEASPAATDLDLLRAHAQELEAQNREYESNFRRQQAWLRQEQERLAFVSIESEYEQRVQQLERLAEDDPNPVGYMRLNMAALNVSIPTQLESRMQRREICANPRFALDGRRIGGALEQRTSQGAPSNRSCVPNG